MKVITDYFRQPSARSEPEMNTNEEKAKCNSSLNDSSGVSDDCDVYYTTRKLKIRLADPNVPDSYVCEIYDTSLEDVVEDEEENKSYHQTKNSPKKTIQQTMPTKTSNKRRLSCKESKNIESSDSSSDEALISLKKRLKTSQENDRKPSKIKTENSSKPILNVQRNEEGSRPVRTRSSDSTIDKTSSTDAIEPPTVKKRPCRRTKGNIESFFNSPTTNKETMETNVSSKDLRQSKKISKSENERSAENQIGKLKVDAKDDAKSRPVALAPLFVKKAKKTVIDIEADNARKRFLQSGLPTATRKKVENLKAAENQITSFPVVTHVQQRNDEPEWKVRKINLSLKSLGIYDSTNVTWRSVKNNYVHSKAKLKSIDKKATVDKDCLDTLQQFYKNIKVDCLYESLKKRKISWDQSKAMDDCSCPVWSNKYCLGSSDAINNENSIKKLKKWLQAWKEYGEDLRHGIKRKKTTGNGSSDDFVSSDEEDEFVPRAPITACLLQGPISSGKTSVVRSLAEEMNFHVLEMNSSSKRSGKKMLTDLQEATQSHKILQEANGNICSRTGSEGTKDAMSVIVVEEADILFEEQDDGFVSGLLTLVSSAKRPVLLLTNDASVQHLNRFRTSQTLQIAFNRPLLSTGCIILELISLIEGFYPPRSSLIQLLSKNQLDLRRSLLELQFWLEKNQGIPVWGLLGYQPLDTGGLWWTSHQILYQRDLWHSDQLNKPESHSPTDAIVSNDENNEKFSHLPHFIMFHENLSLCDRLVRKENDVFSELNNSKVTLKNSSSLNEDYSDGGRSHKELMTDIEGEILRLTLHCVSNGLGKKINPSTLPSMVPAKEIRWLSKKKKATDELEMAAKGESLKRALDCDYLPALRSICRVEEQRMASNSKRGNRFFHYLRTLGADVNQTNLEFNCRVFNWPMP